MQTPSPYLSRGTVIAEVAQELRVHRRTIDLFEHAAAERLGVNATDAHCLEILEREGRVTAGELARGLGLTTSAVTALIDRLERAGYIARVRTPADRRRVYVELTSHGRERAAEIWDPLEGPLHDLVASYNNHELTLIRDFLRRSRQILAERAASIRPPRPE